MQDKLQEVLDCGGVEDEAYSRALEYIQYQCRTQGIDAALRSGAEEERRAEFDALLLCDRKGAGQQLAAQAGTHTLHSSSSMTWLRFLKGILLSVYR